MGRLGWFYCWKTAKTLLPLLREFVSKAYVKKLSVLSAESENTTDAIIEMIEDARSFNKAALTSIPANTIVEAFSGGTPQEQNKFRKAFISLGSYLPSNLGRIEYIYSWLKEIKIALDKLPRQSIMNELRKSYFSQNLDDLLSQLGGKD